MKKKLLKIVFFTILINHADAQDRIAYHDAVYLKNVIEKNGGKFQISNETRPILKFYLGDKTDDLLTSVIKSNSLLNKYYEEPSYFIDNHLTFNEVIAPKVSTNVMGIDVTRFADGLAKFIVERTKKELQATFFDKFVKTMDGQDYEDLRTLFPMTYGVIKRLPSDVYDYQPYIQSLREAFGKDLQNILPNLEIVLKNGQYKQLFDNHKELKSICLTALNFAKGVQKGDHIGTVLENYHPLDKQYDFSDAEMNSTKNSAFLFLKEVSKSFKTNAGGSTEEYWIDSGKIRNLINDDLLLDLYIGLLYERVKNLPVWGNQRLTYGEVLMDAKNSGTKLNSFFEELAYQIESVQTQRENIQSKLPNQRTIDDYISYFNSSVQVMNFLNKSELVQDITNKVPVAIKPDIEKFWKNYDMFIVGTNSALAIYTNLKEKNYSLVISNVRNLYSIRYDSSLLKDDKENREKIDKVISFLLEKGAFIAGVCEAKDSEEVYQAINKVAMPAGSARVKRMSKTNVAVNAYCGLFVGIEKIYGVEEIKKGINTYGLAAPVGISFSKGDCILPWPIHGIFHTKGWSSSLFLSVIDLGAVASFRFTDETAEQVPTIQLKDIFSPGLFWSIGIPKTPISVNFGAQVGPNLRKVTATENDYSQNTYIRYSASVCIDIPIFNLSTASK